MSALACLPQHIIALDSNGNLHLNSAGDSNVELASPLACHNDLVQGVQKFPDNCKLGAFYTWSRRGEVRCWDIDGNLLHSKLVSVYQEHLEDDINQNELRVVRYIPQTKQFVTGDRLGILRLVESQDWSFSWMGRAHGAELTDIAVHESPSFVVTCGRDRMVQLFKVVREALDLIQTMDDHIGAVTQVSFTPDADKLLSCAADRTVVIRERASRQVEGADFTAYLLVRVITLRSTPLSMTFGQSTSTTLFVSTNDRHVVKVDTLTGTIVESSKAIDRRMTTRSL